jgi:UPF0716 protein FxsA
VLVLLLLVLPVLEIWLLVQIGARIGLWPTLGMLIATAILGAQLARAEGVRVLEKVQRALAEGRPPEQELMGGLLVFVGGLLLVVPGVITDVGGVLLLLPPTRALVARLLRRRWERALRRGSVVVNARGMGDQPVMPWMRRDLDDEIIDVEAEPVDKPTATPDPAKKLPGPDQE